ncbi:hypothetical protein [Ferrovibrio terrae]|uniref:hypothetical protein n=1 Tax=Ferrovibrio terrae TaxID=2594003 RepID=UPI0031378D6D
MSEFQEKAAASAVLSKYQGLTQELARVEKQIATMRERRSDVISQLRDAAAAARLFGVQLPANFSTASDDPPPAVAAAPAAQAASGQPKATVRELVLEMLAIAYPQPLRAKTINDRLAADHGLEMHEKTVGMTLYRLSQIHMSKRKGFDWYFVPENERPAQEEGAEA